MCEFCINVSCIHTPKACALFMCSLKFTHCISISILSFVTKIPLFMVNLAQNSPHVWMHVCKIHTNLCVFCRRVMHPYTWSTCFMYSLKFILCKFINIIFSSQNPFVHGRFSLKGYAIWVYGRCVFCVYFTHACVSIYLVHVLFIWVWSQIYPLSTCYNHHLLYLVFQPMHGYHTSKAIFQLMYLLFN